MTANRKSKPSVVSVEGLLGQNRDVFKELLRESLKEALAAQMTEAIGAEPGERTPDRAGWRAGYYSRILRSRRCGVDSFDIRMKRACEGRLLFKRNCRARIDQPLDRLPSRRCGHLGRREQRRCAWPLPQHPWRKYAERC